MSKASDIRAAATRYLARREYSVEELRRRLRGKGYDAEQVEQTLRTLQGERLLSDERYTDVYIRSRSQRGFGPRRIELELRDKGVAEQEIAGQLRALGTAWDDELRRVHDKRFGQAMPADFAERAKRSRYLQYRGFTPEQIKSLFNSDDTE